MCQAVGGGLPGRREGCVRFPGGKWKERGPDPRGWRPGRSRRAGRGGHTRVTGSLDNRVLGRQRGPGCRGQQTCALEVLRPREGPKQAKVSRRKGADLTRNAQQPTDGKGLAELICGPGRPPPDTRDVRGTASLARAARAVCATGRRRRHTLRPESRPAVKREATSWLDRVDSCPLGHQHPFPSARSSPTVSLSHTLPLPHTRTHAHTCTHAQKHVCTPHARRARVMWNDGTRDPCPANHGSRLPERQR